MSKPVRPDFALDLGHAGITLLRRGGAGDWSELGTVELDDPSLAESLAALRATARRLGGDGFGTKLVIPNSQILYAEIEAPGPDLASRRAQIARALDGRTPYAVDDLVFDWSGDGPVVTVAVVARETLGEAEDFAASHRFAPLCFVARPDDGSFVGEPFFGLTRAARAKGLGEVARDVSPVLTGTAPAPAAAPDPAELVTRGANGGARKAAPEPQRGPAPKAEPPEPDEKATDAGAEAPEEAPAAAPPAAFSTRRAAPAPDGNPPAAPAFPETGTRRARFSVAPASEGREEPRAAVPAPSAPPPPAASGSEAAHKIVSLPRAKPATGPAGRIPRPALAGPEPKAGEPPRAPAPAEASPRSGASRFSGAFGALASRLRSRATDSTTEEEPPEAAPSTASPATREEGRERGRPAGAAILRLPGRRAATETPAAGARADGAAGAPAPSRLSQRLARGLRNRIARKGEAAASATTPEALAGTPRASGPDAAAAGMALRLPGTPGSASLGSAEALGLTGNAARATAPAAARKPEPVRAEPEDFGLLGRLEPERRSLRLGLIMTVGLIILLLGLGLWAATLTDNRVSRLLGLDPASRDVALAPAAPQPPAPGLPDGSGIGAATAPGPILPQIASPATEAPGQSLIPDDIGRPLNSLSPEELAAMREAGIDLDEAFLLEEELALLEEGLLDPLAAEGRDGPVAEAADAGVPQTDMPGAPLAELPGIGPLIAGIAPLPPAAPTAYLDDLFVSPVGPVTQSQDAAALPDPRRLFGQTAPRGGAAPPPPGSVFDMDERGLVRATPEGARTPEGVTVFAGRPETAPPGRPGDAPGVDADGAINPLAGFRARPRPEGLASRIEEEEAALREMLSAFRPRARPISEQQAQAPESTEPTARAVASSARPGPRPEGFAERAEEIRTALAAEAAAAAAAAASATAPARTAAPTQTAAAAPAAAQPAAAAAAVPVLPTTASVAREATERRVLRLNQINLVGVYGTASQRRALVRLPSGRFVSVEVGDRLDGGQVAAIGADSLSYTRGGRSETLRMPR